MDDARLVVANAMDARERGVRVLTRTECLQAKRAAGLWQASLSNGERGQRQGRRQCGRAVGENGSERAPVAALARRGAPGERQPYRAAEAVRGRARVHPAERRPARGVHDSVRRPAHAGGHDGRTGAGRRRAARGERGRSRLPVPRSEPLPRAPRAARRGGLEVRRRAPALRRRHGGSLRGDAGLHLAPGRRGGPGAGAVGVRRQDHHLPRAGRAGGRQAGAATSRA